MIFAFGLFVCALLAGWLLRRRAPELYERLRRSAGSAPGDAPAEAGWGWTLGGLALLALAFVLLERVEPFYFTQDDILVGELPRTLTGCRLLWSGVWPNYDPFTLLGSPLADVGLYSLTYPPTWLSYAIARHLLGNEYLTYDVFAILHLTAAYFAVLRLARGAGAGGALSVLASLSFVLSGVVLIMGRSWHMVLPSFFFLPFLLNEVQRLARGALRLRGVVTFGLAAGVFFHVGFPQMWIYSLLFCGLSLGLLVASGHVPWRRALAFGSALVLAAAVASLLLLPQLEVTHGVERVGGYGNGVAEGVVAMFLPWPLVSVAHPNEWGTNHFERMGLFYFYGGLFAWLAPLLPALALGSRWARSQLGRYQWLILGLVAFALALGPSFPLWPLLSKLPLFRTINNNPFRLLPFVVLFTSVSGAAFLERALSARERASRAKILVFSVGLLPVAWIVCHALPAFYAYGFRPYPQLPQALAEPLSRGGRVLGVAPLRSTTRDFYAALPHNLPAVYGVPAFDGYDPVIESLPPFRAASRALYLQPVEALRRYGVRHVLLHATTSKPVLSRNPGVKPLELFNRWARPVSQLGSAASVVARNGGVSLLEVSETAPLAFSEQHPHDALPLDISHGDLRVRPLAEGGTVLLNFLHYARMTALADGAAVPLTQDGWGRIRAQVPPGTRELVVSYRPNWLAGALLGAVLGLLALSSWLPIRRFRFDQ